MNSRLVHHTSRLVLVFGLLAASCGGDDEDEEQDVGTAPTVSNLTHDTPTLTVDQASTVSGTVDFSDPDKDVDQIHLEVTIPGGQSQQLPGSDVAGASGLSSGTVGWAFMIQPPSAGSYSFDIWLTDEMDNSSNRVTGTFDAQ